MPKVSVIVPIYNVEDYIEQCLETLVNQTLEEIEIILVNDGSKDNSEKIAKQYKEKYPNKITYLEKENGGLSDARNFGIHHAKGEYIAFLDSDDYVELVMYEEMYKIAKKEDSDIVECDFYWEYPNKTKIDTGIVYQGKQEALEKIRVVAWNKLIKRELLEQTKIQFPKGYLYEDIEFTYKLIPYCNKFSFLKKTCVHYRQRENSIINKQNKRTKEIFDVLEHVITYYKQNDLFETYKEVLEYIYTRYLLCSSLLRMVKIQDKKLRKELLEKTWTNLNTKFPNWKKNKILKQAKGGKNLYMKSINSFTYPIFCKIFRIKG
ncbi:MAG: glycosyltransferase [Clostridia bacterium]|nr:glycosyltransferase [Clostridia bacterium]